MYLDEILCFKSSHLENVSEIEIALELCAKFQITTNVAISLVVNNVIPILIGSLI